MKISELGLKAVIANLWGEIGFVGKVKEISGTSKTGKEFSFHTQFVVLNNVEGKVINPIDDSEIEISDKSCAINLTVHSKEPITKEMKGQTLSLSNLTIHEYESEEGVKRTLNASMPKKPEPKSVKTEGKKPEIKEEITNETAIYDLVKDTNTKVNELADWIIYQKKPIFSVEKPLKNKLQEVAVKVEPDNTDIIYNDNDLHVEAIYKKDLKIWDITLYDIPAKSSFPPLPLEISGFAQTNAGKKTIVGQIISRLDKDPNNHKLIKLIREKLE